MSKTNFPGRLPVKQLFLLAIIFCYHSIAFSQETTTISGVVADSASNAPLPSVSVLVKGTARGTTTDANGKYSIKASSNSTLIFRSVGYGEKQITVGNQSVIDISLSTSNQNLDPVVVVAYGTQKKTSVTAAISTLNGDEIDAVPISNLSNAIVGRVSGVILKQGSGEPGRDQSSFLIRGISSTGSTQPLMVVDGIPRGFYALDPNTVESITILKDAAAVAPYGVAGANGVVLVTTKRGAKGTPALSYNGYIGFQNATVLSHYVNSYQFATLKNAAAKNDGLPPPYTNSDLQKYKDGSDPDAYPRGDFYKQIIKSNSILTNHDIELAGGNDQIKYYASFGYQHQGGMWSKTNSNRYNTSISLDAEATKTTKISFSVIGRVQKNAYSPAGAAYGLVATSLPIDAFQYSNGLPGNFAGAYFLNDGYSRNDITQIYSQLSVEQKIPFITGLTAKATVAYDPTIIMGKNWTTPIHIYSIDTTQHPYVYKDGILGTTKPSLSEQVSQAQQITFQGSLNYVKKLGKNRIGALALFETNAVNSQNLETGRKNYNLFLDEISMGGSSSGDITNSGSSAATRQLGLVYRVTYDYSSKYLFEASGRYDGSYFFAPGKRFGFFPAFSIGWRLSEENFIKKNLLWIDNLKVRASYGEAGALAGSAFQYLGTYAIASPAYAFNGNAVQGVNERSEPNPNITWERAKKTDVGLEATLWKGILKVEADYFHEKRSNMLVTPDVIVPSEYGIGLSQVNAGVMENKGVDFSVGSVYPISGDFEVSLTTNFTYAQNTLLQVFETTTTYNNPNRRITGKPLGTQFGFKSLGFFQLNDFDNNGNLKEGIAIQPWGKVLPGDIRYKDINNDGKINDDDLTKIGDPAIPQIIYGISPGLRYKGLSLDLLFQGAAKTNFYYVRQGAWPFHSSGSAFVEHLNYWTPENPNAKNPRITSAPTTNNTQVSSFWMQDASYVRLKSATLSYYLPLKVTEKIRIKNARIYISGQNILTWTRMINYDPENTNSLGPNYPPQKVISLGLNVTF